MKLKTRHFGEIEIDENEIVSFSEGLIGFSDMKKYIVINNPDPEVPFAWLQSVDDHNLTFVITNPYIFMDDYEFDIPDRGVKELELERQEDVIIYTIAVVPDNVENMTINIQAPIVINSKNRKARQIVLDNEKYPIRYYLFKPVSIYGGEE